MMWRPVLVTLCLLTHAPAWAAQSVTFATNGTGAGQPWSGSASASVTIAIASGDKACVMFGNGANNRSVSSVTDDGGNSYGTVKVTHENTGAFLEAWAYCTSATATATAITATLDSSTTNRGFLVAWKLTNSDAAGNTGDGETDLGVSHTTTGNVSLTGSASTLLGCTMGSNGAYTIDAGTWTEDNKTTSVSITIVCGHKAVTGAATMTNTSGVNEDSVTLVIEIPETVGAASPSYFKRRLGGM